MISKVFTENEFNLLTIEKLKISRDPRVGKHDKIKIKNDLTFMYNEEWQLLRPFYFPFSHR